MTCVNIRRLLKRTVLVALPMVLLAAVSCAGSESPDEAESTVPVPSDLEAPTTEPRIWAGTDAAPEFPGGRSWFNVTEPLTIESLRGKMVLLDFWTAGCINCQHIIPDLIRLEEEFGNKLVIIGVHSGKYEEEHEDEAISEAIQRFGVTHPVVNDADFLIWNTYGVRAWPTVVLIDPAGNIVGGNPGEGVYDVFQPVITALALEFEGKFDDGPLPYALDVSVVSTFLSYPTEVLADEAGGRLFVTDAGHHRIVVTDLEGRVQYAIGSGQAGFVDGSQEIAQFRDPQGLALSEDGRTLYVADTRNHAVRAIDLETRRVTTIAGTGNQTRTVLEDLAVGIETDLASPWDVLQDGNTLFIAMAGLHQIWSLDLKTGLIEVFAGTRAEGIQNGNRRLAATLAQPSGMTTDGVRLYWVDPETSSVRATLLDGSGWVETIVGVGLFDFGDVDGDKSTARLQHPQGLAYVDGTLLVADTYNHKLRSVNAETGSVVTAAGTGESGWADGAGSSAAFEEPNAVSLIGRLAYIADTNNHLIRTYDLDTGEVGTLELSNLSAASLAFAGSVIQVHLESVSVAPGVSTVSFVLRAPEGFQLNSLAPSKLTLSSSNAAVVELGESAVSWETDDIQVTLPIPTVFGSGKATITANGTVYYCRYGEQALCLIQQIELIVPITVEPGASAGTVEVEYVLPVSG